MALSVAAAVLAGLLLAMPLKEAVAVGAGFGWYSLSGVLIAATHSVELGATAFLANVARELMAFLLIPLLVSRVGKLAAIAPGGATTMDSTLPSSPGSPTPARRGCFRQRPCPDRRRAGAYTPVFSAVKKEAGSHLPFNLLNA